MECCRLESNVHKKKTLYFWTINSSQIEKKLISFKLIGPSILIIFGFVAWNWANHIFWLSKMILLYPKKLWHNFMIINYAIIIRKIKRINVVGIAMANPCSNCLYFLFDNNMENNVNSNNLSKELWWLQEWWII